jgi:glycosyltransferase involved in cell wall biosynthesis
MDSTISSQVSTTSTERRRILVLIKGLGIGGAERLIVESSRFWNRSAFEYHVVYMLPWKDQLVPQLRSAEVDVSCMDWRRPPGLVAINRLRRLYVSWRPQIVHSHLPAAAVVGRLALHGTNHVYTEHNIVDSYRQPTRWLNRLTYNRNTAVVAVSSAVADSISRYPGPTPTVIPNGVSVVVSDEEAASARAEVGIAPQEPLLVHVGNIRPHKGHSNLIAATEILLDRVPGATVVSIGGEKRPGDLERVRTEAKARGLGERLRFLGRREDARSFLATADVVVNPADVEGLPVALLEAMALGRPVVATSVGGVPSVVLHERTGLLVPPRDPEALAAGMAHAITSPHSMEWGNQAARLIQREYGLGRMVEAYENLYDRMLDG